MVAYCTSEIASWYIFTGDNHSKQCIPSQLFSKLSKHLNDGELAGEAIKAGKHKRGLEVPLHNRPLLEVLGQVATAIHVGVSVALADSEGLLNLLNALLWLHTEDLFCHIVVCLGG